MNNIELDAKIETWENPDAELVRIIDIDIDNGTVERIVKRNNLYTLYRYFELPSGIQVSIDYQDVDADRIICELAERI